MLMLSTITVYAIVITATKLVGDMLLGEAFLDQAALKDTFGLILTILILLEFNHSVYVALTEHSGAIQARILVLITILVIARKLILMDFTTNESQTLLGFGGLLLAMSEGPIGEVITATACSPEENRRQQIHQSSSRVSSRSPLLMLFDTRVLNCAINSRSRQAASIRASNAVNAPKIHHL
jgi:uncharacterized membrane protein (DUF373 family)